VTAVRRAGALLVSIAVLASLVGGPAASGAGTGGRVLATGDSMIQYVDAALSQRLERRRRVRVASDAHVSTGLSKPSLLNWPRYAKQQVRRYRPRVTVMFIGANDGFPMTNRSGRSVGCCGKQWRDEYARRAMAMMRTYGRRGRGRVYWLLLPQARSGFFRRVFPAVNAGVRKAARRSGNRRQLIHLNRVFTPGGRFRSAMRYRGRLVTVRQPDGVHLTPAGASIAADEVVAAIDRGHALARPRLGGRFRGPRDQSKASAPRRR